MYLPRSLQLECVGVGCFNLGELYFDSELSVAEVGRSWTVDASCDLCESVTDCVNHFELDCAESSVAYTFNNSRVGGDVEFESDENCTAASENDCGCHELLFEAIEFRGCTTLE